MPESNPTCHRILAYQMSLRGAGSQHNQEGTMQFQHSKSSHPINWYTSHQWPFSL